MLETLRNEVWKCNLELPKQGLVKMTSGNVSGRDPVSGLVVIKPSGVAYKVTHFAMLHGEPTILTDAQIEVMIGLYRDNYGQGRKSRGEPG